MNYWFLLLTLVLSTNAVAQTENNAYKLGVEGIQAIDAGNSKVGIKLLKAAWAKEPSSYDYPFEIGRALFASGDFKKAEKYLFPLQYHQNVRADLYLLLAKCYQQIEEQKKKPNPACKKELDALRYGIQKLPESGELYLQLAQRKVDLDQPVEALVVLESGIVNEPNFAPNYFWAAKLMKAAGNELWAWVYAEVFLNMTDDEEMRRSASLIAASSSQFIFSNSWTAEPEKMDQDLQFLLRNDCKTQSTGFEQMQHKRNCLINEWAKTEYPISILIDRMIDLDQRGFLGAYLASVYLESDKDKLLPWLAGKADLYERYRKWRYYNPLFISKPLKRI